MGNIVSRTFRYLADQIDSQPPVDVQPAPVDVQPVVVQPAVFQLPPPPRRSPPVLKQVSTVKSVVSKSDDKWENNMYWP